MTLTPKLFDCEIINVEFGEGVKIIRPANLYGCKIGDRSFVGPFTEIQRNVVIGSDCRIQSHTFICEFVNIGERCFIGHGVMFINDLFSDGGPARGDKSKWKPTRIGNDVSVGSNATILPVNIADRVIIGAGAVVTRDINKPGVYAGNPARLIRVL
jgi:acetyltransferase-like isoleucine patch superfamily enzyme